jgi:hypothetical protein
MNHQEMRTRRDRADFEALRDEVATLRIALAERDRAAQELLRQFEERAMELNCLL